MKRAFIGLLIIASLAFLTVNVCANRELPLVYDSAQLLSGSEYDSLLNKLNELSDGIQAEIAVVTVNSLEGKSAMAYADDFYDENGYGYGVNDDGILLLVSMSEREYYIKKHGTALQSIDDYELMDIEDSFIDYLSDGDYYLAFIRYAEAAEYYISEDGASYGNEPFDVKGALVISIVVGFVISLIIVLTMKHKMTTVRPAVNARSYVVSNSLKLHRESDRYLYAQVTRTPRSNSSSGGRSGGGSSHRSSSGRSHGGRGGRF